MTRKQQTDLHEDLATQVDIETLFTELKVFLLIALAVHFAVFYGAVALIINL